MRTRRLVVSTVHPIDARSCPVSTGANSRARSAIPRPSPSSFAAITRRTFGISAAPCQINAIVGRLLSGVVARLRAPERHATVPDDPAAIGLQVRQEGGATVVLRLGGQHFGP